MTANHQHVGPSGTVTCDLIHPETPHDLVRPAAPQEDGWEELRREIEALPHRTDEIGPLLVESTVVNRPAVLAIVDRLAAARGEPGLREAVEPVVAAYHILAPHHTVSWKECPLDSCSKVRAALATPTTPEPDQ